MSQPSALVKSLLEQIPRSVGVTQLKTFLQGQTIGSFDLLWNYSPTDAEPTVGFRFRRYEKEPGAYYRDPYPLTVCVYSSVFSELPIVEAALDSTDVSTLLTSLQNNG